MKKSFLGCEKPLITAMIGCGTPEECIAKIGRSLEAGAEAIGVQLEWLEGQYRTRKHIAEIFAACEGLPVYATARRGGEVLCSDEMLCDLLRNAWACGATMVDVMGDLFARNLTCGMNIHPLDVTRQLRMVERLRHSGCEVLMSAAVSGSLSVYEYEMIASDQVSRGADVIGIFRRGLAREALPEYRRAVERVAEMTQKPIQLEISGEGISFADMPQSALCMYRCVESRGAHDSADLPLISEVRALYNK